MGRMMVLDRSGHTEVEWVEDDRESVVAAHQEFTRLRTCGYLPFGKRRPTSQPHQMRDFEPALDEIFWVRPLVGG